MILMYKMHEYQIIHNKIHEYKVFGFNVSTTNLQLKAKSKTITSN